MCHRLFEGFLTRHALPDDAGDFLQTMNDPHALPGSTEDLFGAGVKLIIVNEADICAHIFVVSREYDGEFFLVFDGGVDESAADADDATFVDEGVVADERRIS